MRLDLRIHAGRAVRPAQLHEPAHGQREHDGLFVYNFEHLFDEATERLAEWIKSGELRPVEDIVDGFDNMPDALARLYDGENVGVQVCRVRPDP